jgi:hypothetical protein
MSKTFLRHILNPYLYTFSLYDNLSSIGYYSNFEIIMSNIIFQVPMGDCCWCREPLSNRKPTVAIREKGAKNINEYSKLRNDSLCVEPGQTLHQDCRREYTNMKSFKGVQQPKRQKQKVVFWGGKNSSRTKIVRDSSVV